MDNNTIRILSIQGGGAKGYIPIVFLQKFCQKWNKKMEELYKYFDVIAGTSIGGILALRLAAGLNSDSIEATFKQDVKSLFAPKIGTAAKLAKIATNTSFYSDTPLQNALIRDFSDKTLADLKTTVVVPSFEKDLSRFVMFSNFNDPMFIGQNETIVNVARATSAAPLYLPSHSFNTHKYLDGGLYANNPAEVAVTVGRMKKPTANRICVLDVGTGLSSVSFDGSSDLTGGDNSIALLFKLMNVAMSGSQEMVNFNLKARANATLEELHYYRFQPKFPPDVSTEMDNSSDKWFGRLESMVQQEYNNKSDDISTFFGHLTA